MTNVDDQTTTEIDEGLYSRQIYVIGKEAMQQMSRSRVLISGMRGLGVEIAKNTILAGVKTVTVQDSELVDVTDLSSQYYFNETDIGYNRAEIAQAKLAELNSYVHVKFSPKPILEHLAEDNRYNVIVLTASSFDEQLAISDYCREHKVKFINTNTKGVFGQIFCDFGENFQVIDTNGENPTVQVVTNITQDADGVVFMPVDSRHGFEDGSYVTFSGVKGMTELNGREFKITTPSPFTITIGDTSGFGAYEGGGTVTEVKKPETIQFKSFRESLAKPDTTIVDFSKMSMPENLHLAFQALGQFQTKYNASPRPWDESDAAKFLEIVEELNNKVPDAPVTSELNKHVMKLFSKTCTGDLCPMQAVIGGIAAQEVMKAITGKFMPIRQFLYFDAIECLPEDIYPAPDANATTSPPINHPTVPTEKSRYFSQEVVFGSDFQHKLGKAKYFIVGSGAIGCEMLKNFAMMGIGCEKDGTVFLTDMDSIERSNLSRQFLFRSADVGKMKSKVAAEAIRKMNPNINIQSFVDPVGPDTEHLYSDTFFEQLNGVANALDNLKARQYIDQRCTFYRKPLIDSGTMGTKASVQVVAPSISEPYSASNDPVDAAVPMCTIRNFPNLIEHTIEWARDNFGGLFTIPAQQAEEFLRDPNKTAKRISQCVTVYDKDEMIRNIQQILVKDRPKNFSDCIAWARNLFQKQFHNHIRQLLHNFPTDHVTKSGERFWSGNKRCPHPLTFDVTNEIHLNFICAAANLFAHIFGIPQVNDRNRVATEVVKVTVPDFQPESGVKIHENDEEMRNEMETEGQQTTSDGSQTAIEEILAQLPNVAAVQGTQIFPHEFEKDDDTNFHIDYIAAAANLRAENYDIETADRGKIKRIAGHIIPAIATTTAMVTGLVCLEIYKLFQGHKKIESYRNTFANLAFSFFCFTEPVPPKKLKYLDHEFTVWDRFEVQGDMTVQELIDHFKKEHKLQLTMIGSGRVVVYSAVLLKPDVIAERMPRKITEVYEQMTKTTIPEHVRSLVLDVFCDDLDGNGVDDVPYIKLTFR